MAVCASVQDLVTTIVTFNRAMYAQLVQQHFEPPRAYPLPAPGSPAFKAADLGMKLTCGFEMVVARNLSGMLLRPLCHVLLLSFLECSSAQSGYHKYSSCIGLTASRGLNKVYTTITAKYRCQGILSIAIAATAETVPCCYANLHGMAHVQLLLYATQIPQSFD